MQSVFISYNWQDKVFAMKLAAELKKNSIKVWIDEEGLKIGDSLPQEIPKAINNNDFVVVVLSNSSIKSRWVNKELAIAMDKEINNRKVVLPVLIEELKREQIPAVIRDKLWADFINSDKFIYSIQKLINAINCFEEPINKELPKLDSKATKQESGLINIKSQKIREVLNKALLGAARDGQVDTVQELLNEGAADPKVRNENRYSILVDMIEALYDVKDLDNVIDRYISIMKLLLKKGALLCEKTGPNGITALMRAAELGNIKLVKALIECGADVNVVSMPDYTALVMAKIHGHTEIIELLKMHGAKE